MMNLCGRVGSYVTSNTLDGGPDQDSDSRIYQGNLCHCRIAAIAWILLVTHEVVDEFMKILKEWISKKPPVLIRITILIQEFSTVILPLRTQHRLYELCQIICHGGGLHSSSVSRFKCRSTDVSGWVGTKRSIRKRSEPDESIKYDTVVSQRPTYIIKPLQTSELTSMHVYKLPTDKLLSVLNNVLTVGQFLEHCGFTR